MRSDSGGVSGTQVRMLTTADLVCPGLRPPQGWSREHALGLQNCSRYGTTCIIPIPLTCPNIGQLHGPETWSKPVGILLGRVLLSCDIVPKCRSDLHCRRGYRRVHCNASAGKGKSATEVTFNPFREVRHHSVTERSLTMHKASRYDISQLAGVEGHAGARVFPTCRWYRSSRPSLGQAMAITRCLSTR